MKAIYKIVLLFAIALLALSACGSLNQQAEEKTVTLTIEYEASPEIAFLVPNFVLPRNETESFTLIKNGNDVYPYNSSYIHSEPMQPGPELFEIRLNEIESDHNGDFCDRDNSNYDADTCFTTLTNYTEIYSAEFQYCHVVSKTDYSCNDGNVELTVHGTLLTFTISNVVSDEDRQEVLDVIEYMNYPILLDDIIFANANYEYRLTNQSNIAP